MSIEEIVEKVGEWWGYTAEDFMETGDVKHEFAYAKYAYFVVATFNGYKQREIIRHVGNKNRSSISRGVAQMARLINRQGRYYYLIRDCLLDFGIRPVDVIEYVKLKRWK